MNILKKIQLKRRQQALMKKRDLYEQLQTKHSQDEYFYKYTQKEMDALDEEVEHIRSVLEGRWDK